MIIQLGRKDDMCRQMTQAEYQKIISNALLDYGMKGGSILQIAVERVKKKYIYEFDSFLSEEVKITLVEKAQIAMNHGDDLPEGIRLIEVRFE